MRSFSDRKTVIHRHAGLRPCRAARRRGPAIAEGAEGRHGVVRFPRRCRPGCPWCHTDLTDSIRAHLYGCAMLPVEVRRRAQAAREAARSLVQSLQVRGTADGLVRQAEASLHALRATMRQAPILGATRETKQIRLLSYHVLPLHLQIGDRVTDETGEWE